MIHHDILLLPNLTEKDHDEFLTARNSFDSQQQSFQKCHELLLTAKISNIFLKANITFKNAYKKCFQKMPSKMSSKMPSQKTIEKFYDSSKCLYITLEMPRLL